MRDNRIIELVEILGVKKKPHFIYMGGSMVIRGLRKETADLDIGVTTEDFENIVKRYNVKREVAVMGAIKVVINFNGDSVEVFDIGTKEDVYKLCPIRKRGVLVQRIEDILDMKMKLNRPKDQEDIKILSSSLVSHTDLSVSTMLPKSIIQYDVNVTDLKDCDNIDRVIDTLLCNRYIQSFASKHTCADIYVDNYSNATIYDYGLCKMTLNIKVREFISDTKPRCQITINGRMITLFIEELMVMLNTSKDESYISFISFPIYDGGTWYDASLTLLREVVVNGEERQCTKK